MTEHGRGFGIIRSEGGIFFGGERWEKTIILKRNGTCVAAARDSAGVGAEKSRNQTKQSGFSAAAVPGQGVWTSRRKYIGEFVNNFFVTLRKGKRVNDQFMHECFFLLSASAA